MRIARAWVVLMKRLGYTRFVAQGGDWGAAVTQTMGAQAPPELLGDPLQHAGHFPARPGEGLRARRPAASRPRGRRAARVRAVEQLLRQARGVRADHVHAATDVVRASGLARRPGGVLARPWRRHRPARTRGKDPRRDLQVRPHSRRPPRQHHAVLADEHRRLRRSLLLGEQGGLLRRQEHHDPVRHQRLSRRALPGSAELGRARVSRQPPLLQRARSGRPLRRVGAAAAVLARDARGVPDAAPRKAPK